MKTQKDWILAYIDTFGEVTPALMGGKVWNGKIWPAEGSKRCREMRTAGILVSHKEGKYEVFSRYRVIASHPAFQPILDNLAPLHRLETLFPVDQVNYQQK